MNKTTIIIPVFNNLIYTKDCIESIYKNTELNSFEIIVVNNASTDSTYEYLKSLKQVHNNFDFINNEVNLGFAKANNQAVKIAETDKVLFLNNDTKVTMGWLDNLIKGIESDEDIKVTGSKLVYEDNTIQHAGIVISKFAENNQKIIYHLYRCFDEHHFSVNKTRFFQCITGACLLTYRDFFIKLGGFSEEYINGFEDIDLCLKVKEAGAKILYCPDSKVYHYESKTQGRHLHTAENTRIFYAKWQNKLIADDYQYYSEDDFKLIEVKREWKEIESSVTQETKTTLKQETLNIIFEKDFFKPVNLIIASNVYSKKESILQLQINTEEQFRLIVLSDNIEMDSLNLFNNLEIQPKDKFSLINLSEIISKNNLRKIIFLVNDEINYKWDKSHKKFEKQELLDCLLRIISKNILKEDINLLEMLIDFFDDIDFFLLLNEVYILNKEYSKSIKILEKCLVKSPMNKNILEALISTLTYLGDISSVTKIKKLLRISL